MQRQTTLTYPDRRVLTRSYGADGDLHQIAFAGAVHARYFTDASDPTGSLGYDPAGRELHRELGNGVMETRGHLSLRDAASAPHGLGRGSRPPAAFSASLRPRPPRCRSSRSTGRRPHRGRLSLRDAGSALRPTFAENHPSVGRSPSQAWLGSTCWRFRGLDL